MYDQATIAAAREIVARGRDACGHSCACFDTVDRNLAALALTAEVDAAVVSPAEAAARIAGMRAAAGPLRIHELTGAVITSIDVDTDAEDHVHIAVALPDGRTTAVVSTQPVPDGPVDPADPYRAPDAWAVFDTTDTDGTVRADAEPTDWQTREREDG